MATFLIRLNEMINIENETDEYYSNVCLVHLYALQGTIDSIEYNRLSKEVRQDINNYCDS